MEKEFISPDFRISNYCVKVNKKMVSDLLGGITFMEPGAKNYKYNLSMPCSEHYYYIHLTEEETEAVEKLSNLLKVL